MAEIRVGDRLRVIRRSGFAAWVLDGSIIEMVEVGDGWVNYALVLDGQASQKCRTTAGIPTDVMLERMAAGNIQRLVDPSASEAERLFRFFHRTRPDPAFARVPEDWSGWAEARVPWSGDLLDAGGVGLCRIRVPRGTIASAERGAGCIQVSLRSTYPNVLELQKSDTSASTLHNGFMELPVSETVLFDIKWGAGPGSMGELRYISGHIEPFLIT